MALYSKNEEMTEIECEENISVSVPAASVFCPVCGTENQFGVKFCGECGARLEGKTWCLINSPASTVGN